MQVNGYMTCLAWVSGVSLAGGPCNSSIQLLVYICSPQYSHLHSTKLACNAPSIPFCPHHPSFKRHGCNIVRLCLIVVARRVAMNTSFSVLNVAWLHPSLSSSTVNEFKEKYECTFASGM